MSLCISSLFDEDDDDDDDDVDLIRQIIQTRSKTLRKVIFRSQSWTS